MSEKTICPNCKNEIGFVFGMCISCGFNYLDHTFHFIKVWRSDFLNDEYWDYLIQKHKQNSEKK